jgi:predicted LPLAT superfamily acyltransferase
MAELITLPSLAISPMAFSLMASNLRRASRAWLRAVASYSRNARDCSSSV